MSLDESNGSPFTMPVTPMYGGYGNQGGFGFGGDWAWILLLLLIGGNGWGMGGFGMGGMMWPMMMGGMGGGFGLDYLYPWLNNSENINGGFRDQMLNTQITSIGDKITSGFGDVATQLCGGFAGVNASISGAQNAIAQQLYTNEIGSLNRSFAEQTANAQGFNSIQAQLAQCCCDNRLATCQTQNLVQNEGAQTRIAIQQQTQAILDKMCQQEIDTLKAQNLALQNQVNMQNLAASQAAQTAALVADNTAQTQYIVNRVAPYPIPAYTVANPVTPAVTR